jgi:hypothetical protein
MSEKETKTKTIEHPLEEMFDIAEGSTMIEYEERMPTVLVDHNEYDEKDKELENQFQEVYDKAMDAFDVQSDIAETVEGKYSARNAEVAAAYLNAALAATKEKSSLKQAKDKLKVAEQRAANNTGGTGAQGGFVVADRNDILEMLRAQQEKEINKLKEVPQDD